jgi:hypothetical protein
VVADEELPVEVEVLTIEELDDELVLSQEGPVQAFP